MTRQLLAWALMCACSTGTFAALTSESLHSRELSKLLNTMDEYKPEQANIDRPKDFKDTVKYLVKPKLKYPENLQEFGNQGRVTLGMYVDQIGNITHVTTLSSVHPELEQAAVQAMLKAKFEPYHEVFTAQQVMDFGIQGNPFDLFPSEGVDPFKIPKASKNLPAEFQYDEPPKIKVAAPTVYPFDLLKDRVKGKARVYVLIDPTGRVRESKVLSATAPEFGLAAQASFQSWEFYPAKKDNKDSWSVITKEYDFNLSNRDTKLSDAANQILSNIKKNKDDFATMQQLDKVPKPLYAPLPQNVSKGITNKTYIEFYLDKEGMVQLPRLQKFENEEQAWLALTALKRWQFEIPTIKGKPVITKLVLPIEFK